ncbi:unnamed protein product, partial [marine sediment metagenome]
MNKNMFALDKILKTLLYMTYYRLEISRRLFIRFILQDKIEKITSDLDELLNFLTSNMNLPIGFNEFQGYLLFFENILKLSSEENYQITKTQIQSKFPELTSQRFGPIISYLKYFEGLGRYLYFYNLDLQVDFRKGWYYDIEFYKYEPELEAGYYFIQVYNLRKNLIEANDKLKQTLDELGGYEIRSSIGFSGD